MFKQLTLCNIFNRRNDFGTPELRAAVASISKEHKDNVLVFLECYIEELAGLPNGRGVQAIANTCTLLDYLHTYGNPLQQNTSFLACLTLGSGHVLKTKRMAKPYSIFPSMRLNY